MEQFEPLREHTMGPYTEELFNRIVGFQMKEHPAWDPNRPFSERIQGLSLHDLIFSCPDRDPAQFGPTVAPYYPLRAELQRIAHYAQQVNNAPLVLDVHAGNGFVGSLLAREGVRVIGLRDPEAKPNQIPDFYDPVCYELREGRLADIGFSFDVAFSSWMPGGENHTPAILAHTPKLVVFVHTDHQDESIGQPQTGTPAAFRELPEDYQLVDEWSVTRPKNLLKEVWPDLTGNIEETRHVKVYAATPYHNLQRVELEDPEPYDWEQDLAMALLAHQGKRWLVSQG